MKRSFTSKISYRLLALFLAFTMILSGSFTASFATVSEEVVEPLCGQEEHVHDEYCYMTQLVLTCDLEADMTHEHVGTCYEYEELFPICGLEEGPGHAHGAECYEATPVIICGQEEREAHVHGESCNTVTETILCGQEASEGHSHGEGCWSTQSVLLCADESEDHQHGEECWGSEDVFVCELPESEGHAHSEECIEMVSTFTCTLEETEGHTHSAECEGFADVLVCDLPETEAHEHSDACKEMKTTLICDIHVHDDAACYVEEKILICEQPVHVHGEECWPVPEDKPEEEKPEVDKPVVPEEPKPAVNISGELPEGAVVTSSELSAEEAAALITFAENEELLFAYDISISLAEGGIYQPKDEGKTVMVTVDAPVELADDQHIVVYHVDGEGNVEKKSCTVNDDGTVSFEADSFSVYIGSMVTDSSVYMVPGVGYGFYNAAGNKLVHSYVKWENGLTIRVKPDVGFELRKVSVVAGEGVSSAANIVKNSDGSYSITFNDPT